MNKWKAILGGGTGIIGITGAAVGPTIGKSSLQVEKKSEKKTIYRSPTPKDLWTRYKAGTLGSHPENQKSLVSYYDPQKYEWWEKTYKKFQSYQGKKDSLFKDLYSWGSLGHRCGQFYEQEIKGSEFNWYGKHDYKYKLTEYQRLLCIRRNYRAKVELG